MGWWTSLSPVPPPGHLRTLAWATLVNTVGMGLWSAGAVLFLTRSAGLSPESVGLGLTIAALVGLSASVPLGRLADRWDPRSLRAGLQILQAGAAASYLIVDSFGIFVFVATVDSLLASGNLAVRAALVAAVAGPQGRVHAFATLRAVANVGISAGAAVAALALAVDTPAAYDALVVGNALTYVVSSALVMRLPSFPGGRHAPSMPPGRWRVLRDRPYLIVSATSAVLSLHSVVLSLVLPLWIVFHTAAPPVIVSAVLVTNTVLTVLLAVWTSRGITSAEAAGRSLRRAGLVLATAMVFYGFANGLSSGAAIALLVAATVLFTIGDLWHSVGGAALAYELADPKAIGEYQGIDQLLAGLARAAGPAVLTLLVINGGRVGWTVLALVFVAAGQLIPPLTRWAAKTRPASQADS